MTDKAAGSIHQAERCCHPMACLSKACEVVISSPLVWLAATAHAIIAAAL